MNLFKKIGKSIAIAFSMYSKIPMAQFEWKEEDMRYSMCFFPLVGIVIGLLSWCWWLFCQQFGIGKMCFAFVGLAIILLVTGGIHMDGYMDTMDALHSYGSREKKLEILKDSHAGAFAVIIGICYFVICFGVASEVTAEQIPLLCLIFGISRSFSALSVVNFPNANPKGTAAVFGNHSVKGRVNGTMIVYLILFCGAAVLLNPLPGLLLMAAAVLTFVYYHHMSLKYFGGITGDLAGFFVCLSELVMLLTVIIVNRIVGIII